MTVAQLAALNGLSVTDGVLIGQTLKLSGTPAPARTSSTTPARTSTATTSTKTAANTSNYTVKAGDTLTGLANRLGVSNADIAALNDFNANSPLIAGQTIKVPASQAAVTRKLNNQPTKYAVQAGDSLTGVAAKHGISIDELAAANNLTRTSNLLLGTTLTIPAAGTTTNRTSSSSASATTSRTTSSANNTTAQPARGTTFKDTENYTVQAGDNLTALANKFGVSVADLAAINNLAANAGLLRGQTIKVPKLTTAYTVKSGDGLISLARRYGISAAELAKMNNLDANANLVIGQKLTVPNK